jgi:hypothetical protein
MGTKFDLLLLRSEQVGGPVLGRCLVRMSVGTQANLTED